MVHPIAQRDAATLIGILAIIEGLVLAEQLDAATEEKIARRFQWAGLLGPAWARDDLARVINGLNQRLRYAVDEYPEPPPPATPG